QVEWSRRFTDMVAFRAIGEVRGDDNGYANQVTFQIPEPEPLRLPEPVRRVQDRHLGRGSAFADDVADEPPGQPLRMARPDGGWRPGHERHATRILPHPETLRRERGLDRVICRLDRAHAVGGVRDASGHAQALELGTSLRQRTGAEHGAGPLELVRG